MRAWSAIVGLLVVVSATGCATKNFRCTSGMVLAFPDDGKDYPGTRLFKTSSESMPNRQSRAPQIVWHGVELGTTSNRYSALQFLVYARQDHFYRMHESLMSQGATVRAILEYDPIDLEPIWDVRPASNPPPAYVDDTAEGLPQTDLWPTFRNPFWYQDEKFTQIRRAREEVESTYVAKNGPRVRVGHIDTGCMTNHSGFPTNVLLDLCASFTDDASLFGDPKPDASDIREDSNHLLHAFGHGVSTLSVLASPAKLGLDGRPDSKGQVQGVVPFAEVVCVRARPTFMHFFPVRLARSIMHCVENNVDVVSVSQGGTASLALTAAINEAYQRGTLVVAASSDFVYPYVIPAAIPFRDMAYPARYKRVLAAAGMTGSFTSYGNNRWHALPKFVMRPWRWETDLLHLGLRGSYGPEELMDNAVCGFAPNVPFADASNPSRFDLDGGGTSATTPQVAGAAALWLQKYMDDFSDPKQRWSWQKVEYLSQALKRSASLRNVSTFEYEKKFGHGYIKAADALSLSPEELKGFVAEKPPDEYPIYEHVSGVFTWIYLQSLDERQRERITNAFDSPERMNRLPQYVGAYMRQAMILRQMLRTRNVSRHAKLEKVVGEFTRRWADVDYRERLGMRPELKRVSKRVAEEFNNTVRAMGSWKKARTPHDWLKSFFLPRLSPAKAEAAICAYAELRKTGKRKSVQDVFLESGAGI